MSSDPYLGEIMIWTGNYAPRGYAFCNGQLLSISQNAALFSILGTTYGGDGRTTFALPDLRGRVPMGQDSSYQGNNYLGAMGGNDSVTFNLVTAEPPDPQGDSVTALAPSPPGQTTYRTAPPYLALSFVIAVQGIYPCRD